MYSLFKELTLMRSAAVDTVRLSPQNFMSCPKLLDFHYQTITVIEAFFLAMLHYPDVYRKAQEQIDRIIGSERLPELTDRGSLPYLEALVIELYRHVAANTYIILPC